jgi:hypothetical protein
MMDIHLPYYCPTFRTEHLLEPCTKNLARVKALKLAKKHVGPLERCLDCKGKVLETKARTVIEGLPAPENWVEERFVNPEPKEYVSPERKGWEPVPEVTTAPLFLRDLGVKEPEKREVAPEFTISSPINPLNPPFFSESAPVSEEAWEKLPPNLTPTEEGVDYLLPKVTITTQKQEKPVPAVKITEKEAAKLGIAPPPEVEVRYIAPLGARYCPTHPEVPQRKDKLNRWMGMCAECVSARGKKCGEQNFERGVTAPPMSIPLNLPKYADIKTWLAAQAEENERSLTQQIIYILKTAWRQGI